MPVLVFIAVMTGVIGLAFVLENARPGQRPPADQVSVVEQFPGEARRSSRRLLATLPAEPPERPSASLRLDRQPGLHERLADLRTVGVERPDVPPVGARPGTGTSVRRSAMSVRRSAWEPSCARRGSGRRRERAGARSDRHVAQAPRRTSESAPSASLTLPEGRPPSCRAASSGASPPRASVRRRGSHAAGRVSSPASLHPSTPPIPTRAATPRIATRRRLGVPAHRGTGSTTAATTGGRGGRSGGTMLAGELTGMKAPGSYSLGRASRASSGSTSASSGLTASLARSGSSITRPRGSPLNLVAAGIERRARPRRNGMRRVDRHGRSIGAACESLKRGA